MIPYLDGFSKRMELAACMASVLCRRRSREIEGWFEGNELDPERRNIFIILASTMSMIRQLLNWQFPAGFTTDTIQGFLTQDLNAADMQDNIVREFQEAVNTLISQKSLQIVDRKDIDKQFQSEADFQNAVIVKKNHILLTKDMVEHHILNRLHCTPSSPQIWRALSLAGFLHCTNGYQNRLEIVLANGENCLLKTYALKNNILTIENFDLLYHPQNDRQNELFFSKKEMPSGTFLPLISNAGGCYAGRQLLNENEENGHIIVTGQSGIGKSVTLIQLAAFHSRIGHQVIAFDSNGSFSKEKLYKHLPKEFVDKYVLLYDIEANGIPINPFYVDGNSQNGNTIILDLLSASSSDLSSRQYGKLSAAIQTLDCSGEIHASDILSALTEHDSGQKVLERFEAVLNAITKLEEKECVCKSWAEFFSMHTDKSIIIFSAPKAYSPFRTPFVDILLASLYNHQISHPDRPLDILIDEIQKENLTSNSPIEQIIAVGRNYRISVIAATQHFKVTKKLKEIIGNIQTKIFLLPATDSITSVLRYLDNPKITPEYLKSMKRGECIIDTTFYSSKSEENKHAVLFGNIANFSKYLSS